MNACYNAVDRHCGGGDNSEDRSNDVAILWEGDERTDVRRITFAELRTSVCKIAGALTASGVRKGDVVTICEFCCLLFCLLFFILSSSSSSSSLWCPGPF